MTKDATATGRDANSFAHSRAYDLACAAPLILVYGFACAGDVILIVRQWPGAHGVPAPATITDEAATLVFFGLQVALCLFRRLPVGKSEGVWPRVTAILGANFNFALLLLPHAALAGFWTIASAALTITGTLAAAAVLLYLGRSFSIFPEARSHVTTGPYRYIRHPLYLAEMVSTLGIMLQFRQPWAAMIALVTIIFQIRRLNFEEDVLRLAFPSYAAYQQATARLLPGLY